MGDGQRVALNALLMLAKQAIMAVLGVIFVGYLARKVGVADWGEFQASLAVANVVTVIAGIGVRGYLAREIAVRPELGPKHLGSALLIRGVTGTLLLGVTVLVSLFGGGGLRAWLVTIAAASQLATLLYSTMWLVFEAHERFQYILYAELAARLFVIGVASLLLALGHGVVAAAVVFMLGNVVELALTAYFVFRRLYRPVFSTTARELVAIAKKSVAIGALGAVAVALQQADRVMLRVLVDEKAVGIYSAAGVLSENFLLIPDLFLGASFAAGMRLYARDREAFRRLYQNCMVVAAVLGAPIAAGVFLLSPEIVALVYGHKSGFDASGTTLRILICQVPVAFAFQVGTLPLLASKREIDILKLMIGGLVANVVLNVALVPRLGAAGSAAATLIVGIGLLTGSSALTLRWVRYVPLSRIAAVLGATSLMTAAAYAADRAAGMWTAVAVGATAYIPLLFVLRAIAPADLWSLARRRPAAPTEPAPA